MADNPSNKVKTESIDGVILRLLGLSPGAEIDYQTYFDLLKKKLAVARMGGKSLPQEEDDLLRAELKRVKVIKEKGIRFRVKTAKVKDTSASTVSSQRRLAPKNGAIVKKQKSAITSSQVVSVNVKDITESQEQQKESFSPIRKTLNSILSILAEKFKFDKKQSDQERKDKETERRGKGESTLEGFRKGIAGIVAVTKKLFSPFANIIERIKRFLFFTLLGVAFNKFMGWLDNKENKKKFDTIVNFLIDHWPALVGLYVLFGTSFGKLVRGLVKGILKTVIALTMNIPKIIAFIKKNKKASLLGFGIASLASGYVSNQVKGIFSDKKTPETDLKPVPELDQAKKIADQAGQTKVPQFNLGGMIPQIPSFNFGGLIPSFSMGGMDLQSGIPISGAGRDDTLIAAKTGEAILTEKDQVDLSQRYVDRTTGQPLNIPQYLSGRKPGSVNMANLRFPGFGGGFFGGGLIPQFNSGGVVGGRSLGKSPGRKWSPLESIIGNAQQRLLNRQAERNTQFYNPLADIFRKPNWMERLPSYDPELRRYGMPGYNQDKWQQLRQFRESGPKRNQPRNMSPISLQGGGLVQGTKNWFGNLFGFGNSRSTQSRRSPKPKILEEYQSPEAQALLRTIRAAEHYRGANPYQSIYGGGNIPALTQMTVKEVIDMGNSGKLPMRFGGQSAGYGSGSAATGAYQFMPFTLQDLIRRGVVKPNQIMTPSLQDKLGWELVKNRGVNLGSLRRTGLNQSIMDMMAPEWASFPHSPSGGKSYYGQPVKGSDFLRQIYLDSLNQNKVTKKQGGGSIKENTGVNIPGATADRQLIAAQPGEYMLPVDTVNRLGLPFIEKLVALTDSNSEAYLKKGRVRRPEITPYGMMNSGGMGGVMTLPAITQSASGNRARASGYGGGSSVPDFSVLSPNNERSLNASIYGLIESTV